MSIEAMKQALKLLRKKEWESCDYTSNAMEAAEILEKAIAEAEKQEPYCWTWDRWISGGTWRAEYGWKKPEQQVTNLQPLYTYPQPKREPLTDEQIENLYFDGFSISKLKEFARAIEAAHGIKE